ncbi:hypothetical protein RHO15_00685 [Utexia brackfieldae]|uniref:hypothetical protein n=1 Tax=Utexia brackfieldae TaxID=3074108 RepID=UPI00370DCAFF
MKQHFLMPMIAAALILSGCDSGQKHEATTEQNSVSGQNISTEDEGLVENKPQDVTAMPINQIMINNQLILTRTVEAYSPNPMTKQVIIKTKGDNKIEKTISYNNEGLITSYLYTYSNKGQAYLTGEIKYQDDHWQEDIHNVTNNIQMTIIYNTDQHHLITSCTLSDSNIDINQDFFKSPFAYNSAYQLISMYYILNGLELQSLYQYDTQGHIQHERIILPTLEAQADANYDYNAQGQLMGFQATELYSMNDSALTEADKKIDESFTRVDINQRGDWIKLTSENGDDVMTRTITYR